MELIPGLPNDIARQCLIRVHCTQYSTISWVCKAWKSELQSPEFRRDRMQVCEGKQLFLFKCWSGNTYKLILLEPNTRIWSELPPIPELPNELPSTFNFTMASIRRGFVVVGGPHDYYKGKMPSYNKVFVFDYLAGTWRRGVDMPTENLNVYRCTSDRDRMVYVLCTQHGHTECIMVYDVMKDAWTTRIDTEGRGGRFILGSMHGMIYHSSKIHFYDMWTIAAGDTTDKRVFNVSTWKWDPSDVDFKDLRSTDLCLTDDGEWYSCINSSLITYKDSISTWQDIGQMPKEEGEHFDYMTNWKNKLMLILGRWDSDNMRPFAVRVLDLKNHKLTTLDTPKEFRGEVKASCYLEI